MDSNRAFLNVTRSVTGMRWTDRLDPRLDNVALDIAQKAGVPDLVARILAGRGVLASEAVDFLNPTIKALMPDPYTMVDMEPAAERIARAIHDKECVAIFGDYDVDGATSSALLSRFLTHYGVKNTIYIPDRITEGYGPNPTAIIDLIENGAELIVTVDCGVTSFDALEEAAKKGVDVVVLDHHQVGNKLPRAAAVVNANRTDDASGLGHMAAVGTTFMALVAVQRALKQSISSTSSDDVENHPNLLSMLDIVALGTVCDIVPLRTLNRAFVRRGLEVFRKLENVGLAALSRAARVDGPISAHHLGFLLGPRINAGGRIGDASLGARLLTLDDPYEADEIAQKLDLLNKERQAIEKEMLEEADAQAFAEIGADGSDDGGPSVSVVSSERWHPGILGLVASRLKERYRRPAFALAFDKNGMATGSGRSISGVDLGAAVRFAVNAGLLEKGGGNAMAAGLTVKQDRMGDLRAFLEERLGDDVAKARASRSVIVDGALTARAATLELLDTIDRAGPFGAGHPTPIFVLPGHRLSFSGVVGQGHVKATIKSGDGASLNAIAFGVADEPLGRTLLDGRHKPLHFAGMLSRNTWQGRQSVQMRIIDVAVPSAT